ncbi:MAG TPA: hypothetical protein VMG10_32815 [Gemmataceae bacterium]|nr:hypothetical protein [Gemmataceae bacterium]
MKNPPVVTNAVAGMGGTVQLTVSLPVEAASVGEQIAQRIEAERVRFRSENQAYLSLVKANERVAAARLELAEHAQRVAAAPAAIAAAVCRDADPSAFEDLETNAEETRKRLKHRQAILEEQAARAHQAARVAWHNHSLDWLRAEAQKAQEAYAEALAKIQLPERVLSSVAAAAHAQIVAATVHPVRRRELCRDDP